MAVPPPNLDRSLFRRALGAARFDVSVYEEVEADPTATTQAMVVVVASSAATGIGMRAGFNPLVVGMLGALFAWWVWALLTYWIGTRVLAEPETRATQGELLRTLGFASAPGILRVVGVVPGLSWIVFTVTAVWMLVAAVIAVRQALDYRSVWRAPVVVLTAWAVQLMVLAVVFWVARNAV
jgi:hypothetical protein